MVWLAVQSLTNFCILFIRQLVCICISKHNLTAWYQSENSPITNENPLTWFVFLNWHWANFIFFTFDFHYLRPCGYETPTSLFRPSAESAMKLTQRYCRLHSKKQMHQLYCKSEYDSTWSRTFPPWWPVTICLISLRSIRKIEFFLSDVSEETQGK